MTSADHRINLTVVSPERILRLLDDAHWERTGGREELYIRYAVPAGTLGAQRSTVVVPLDQNATDFKPLLTELLNSLREIRGDDPGSSILSRLLAAPTDEYSFAKDTAAPRGWIRWDEGMDLIKSARLLLASGAKGSRERMRYYGNRYGTFASRFLDEVMMGQTTVSSYVVRAYVPTQASIPLKAVPEGDQTLLFGTEAISGRQISQTLVETLESASDALDHYRTHQSIAGFTDPSSLLSYEAIVALRSIAENADDSAIRISWESDSPTEPDSRWEFAFTASAVPILDRAANELVSPEPQRRVRASGTVHLLSRADAGGPGIVGITTMTGEPAKKVRVHLNEEDYHRALRAHDEGSVVHVFGNLEREGNLSWLYQAHITEVEGTQNRSDNDLFTEE